MILCKHVSLSKLLLILCVFAGWCYANFEPHRMYKLRQKVSLDTGWKFYRNTPAGTPSAVDYDDATWENVNVPHSAMYVPPTPEGEASAMPGGSWTGICWYRKTFTVPSGAHTQKIYLEFEGAMQTALVYVNGQLAGGHGASGYTPFYFDITSLVNTTGTNVIAVRLDCNYLWEVPPGNKPNTGYGGEYPDFYIYSGLYRDVWLVCTDNVHIPIWGQQITTPVATASSATVRIRTTVKNDNSSAVNCAVQSVVVNSAGTIITQTTANATVAPGSSQMVEMTTPAIASPSLWSPESPNLYRVFTKVFVNNVEVDDYVERIGIRSLDWRTSGGFYLNGQRCLLKGVNMHQVFAWVGNALPNSRLYEEVRLVKNMGANAIRCSHYPRDPAFYDACDELGVICEPELPSWGGSITQYPQIFWNRLDTCSQEMVRSAFNHPSIIMWGLFNEAAGNFPTQFTSLKNRIMSIDSTRFTSVINNKEQTANQTTDVFGYNYSYIPSWTGARYYNSEYHEGWMYACRRGDTVATTTTKECFVTTCYLRSENEFAKERYTDRWVRDILNNTGPTKPLAGGHMWVFVDYWTPNNVGNHCMGVLDHYRIPKKVFYTFRSAWTGEAADTFFTGTTPTHVQLDADLTTITADSTDITRIVASLRDASGRCVYDNRPITLSLSGPVDCFDTLTRTTIAGKIGWILKSKNRTGTITATATVSGLTPGTVTIQSVARDNSALPFIWPGNGIVLNKKEFFTEKTVRIRYSGHTIRVEFTKPVESSVKLSLVTPQGKTVYRQDCNAAVSTEIPIRSLGAGIYYVMFGVKNPAVIKKIVVAE
jgi:beta-galactosidase